MNLSERPHRIVETVDRRVLAGFQFVDAVTRVPLAVSASVAAREATIPGIPGEVRLPENAVDIRQNRRGVFVLFRAPLFDTYTASFTNPQDPPEVQNGPLRLRLSVGDAGPHYLPQRFQLELPRALDPAAAATVFEPVRVGLFRSPRAPVRDGWAVLRVSVAQAGANPPRPLAGVLVGVFRSPRGAGDLPIGAGMTDWREEARGEALVAVADIQRFRAGQGPNVVETEQEIVLEATRDNGFTGAPGQLPDVARLLAGTGTGIIRPPDRPAGSQLTVVRPATPLRVRPGREYAVELAMP